MASKSSVSKSIGLKAVYRFQGEQVHAFECYPKAEESSNEYLTKNDDSEAANHDFSGKMDGGVTIPTLKSSGPFASLVTSIKKAKEDSEAFLKDRVEGPVSSKYYE